jgi:hypothetical protein
MSKMKLQRESFESSPKGYSPEPAFSFEDSFGNPDIAAQVFGHGRPAVYTYKLTATTPLMVERTAENDACPHLPPHDPWL